MKTQTHTFTHTQTHTKTHTRGNFYLYSKSNKNEYELRFFYFANNFIQIQIKKLVLINCPLNIKYLCNVCPSVLQDIAEEKSKAPGLIFM